MQVAFWGRPGGTTSLVQLPSVTKMILWSRSKGHMFGTWRMSWVPRRSCRHTVFCHLPINEAHFFFATFSSFEKVQFIDGCHSTYSCHWNTIKSKHQTKLYVNTNKITDVFDCLKKIPIKTELFICHQDPVRCKNVSRRRNFYRIHWIRPGSVGSGNLSYKGWTAKPFGRFAVILTTWWVQHFFPQTWYSKIHSPDSPGPFTRPRWIEALKCGFLLALIPVQVSGDQKLRIRKKDIL